MRDIANPRLLGEILATGVNPQRTAIIDLSDGTERRYTYGELNGGATAVAKKLHKRGWPPGTRIGILANNSARYHAALFGALRAGCVVVPINPRAGRESIEFICKDASVQELFVDEGSLETAPANVSRLEIASIPLEGLEEGPAAVDSHPDEPALILYTSGSTGIPKGVVLSHESQIIMVRGYLTPSVISLVEKSPCIVAAPLFHMNGLVFSEIVLQLGGAIVLMAQFDAGRFISALERYQVGILSGVPTMVALMAQETALLRQADLSSVHLVIIGSAPLSDSVKEQVRRIFPSAEIINSYGTTETGAGYFGAHPSNVPRPPMSVGYPQPHAELRLTGGEDSAEGVLEVRSPTNMIEYLNLPELTRSKMQNGWINTGDIMRRDADGFFYFIGRADDMFVCSGENVYPGEVERIIEQHPGVLEVCVVAVADDVRGAMPVAFIVRRPAVNVSEEEIKALVLAKASPHLHPRRVWFIDQMPLSGTNKIDRKALTVLATRRAYESITRAHQ